MSKKTARKIIQSMKKGCTVKEFLNSIDMGARPAAAYSQQIYIKRG